jgi:hypothetical protein
MHALAAITASAIFIAVVALGTTASMGHFLPTSKDDSC